MNTTELLFLLLRSEICGNKNEVITESLSENDLKSLFRLAKAHDIAHIIWRSTVFSLQTKQLRDFSASR